MWSISKDMPPGARQRVTRAGRGSSSPSIGRLRWLRPLGRVEHTLQVRREHGAHVLGGDLTCKVRGHKGVRELWPKVQRQNDDLDPEVRSPRDLFADILNI
jgi:hypothetical protein